MWLLISVRLFPARCHVRPAFGVVDRSIGGMSLFCDVLFYDLVPSFFFCYANELLLVACMSTGNVRVCVFIIRIICYPPSLKLWNWPLQP
jgi:hypothetical protein